MKFVLFRHAHKGILPFEDPELSLQGFEQAHRISDLISKNSLSIPTRLFCSPKRRTSQTFYPSAQRLGLKTEVNPDLDQRASQESSIDFKNRVQKFLRQIEKLNGNLVIFACTHYDWIEEAMALINSDKDLKSFEFSHWSPTQYVEFEIENNLWKVTMKGTANENS